MMTRTPTPAEARAGLSAWRRAYPQDPYAADHHLRALNARYLEGSRLADVEATARAFGQVVAGEVAALVTEYEAHPPELVRYDGDGNAIEHIRFDEAYHHAARLLWEGGLMQFTREAGSSFEQANLAYLAALEGEMGHLCAATCTTGMVRVIRRHGGETLTARYVPALSSSDHAEAMRGAQFLTEVQGGSDVGANAAMAEPVGDGTYRLSGEKWFCSVADADVFLVLARPPEAPSGTAGLGCFVVPRIIDGRPNGFAIKRLKDKLGTTSMASAEIEFVEAVAYPVGEVGSGFKIMVTAMLNTSRWLNAIGNLGMMRRAYLEASAFARHRIAFGRPIGEFAILRRTLADMKAEWLGALHSTWLLTALDEEVDVEAMGGQSLEPDRRELHRFLVNANKLVVSLASTDVVRAGIEVLGGNGAIESFSVLPRLLRDSIVFEQWEGTHNVLTSQVLRDAGRLGLVGTVFDHVARTLKAVAAEDLAPIATTAVDACEPLADLVVRCVEDEDYGALHFRPVLERTVRAVQVAELLATAESAAEESVRREASAAADHLTRTYLDSGYHAEHDPALLERIDRLLGSDAG